MTKLENLTPEEIRGHEEPAIRWTTKLENPILEEHRGHEDMDPLSTIVNLSLNSHGSLRSLDPSVISDNVHAISPEIDGDHPPHLPLTVYYNCVSRDNLERIGKEYGCNEGEMIRPIKRDGIREVVDGLPQSNTCLDWKYCTSSIEYDLYRPYTNSPTRYSPLLVSFYILPAFLH